jgi:hypothetical protein
MAGGKGEKSALLLIRPTLSDFAQARRAERLVARRAPTRRASRKSRTRRRLAYRYDCHLLDPHPSPHISSGASHFAFHHSTHVTSHRTTAAPPCCLFDTTTDASRTLPSPSTTY